MQTSKQAEADLGFAEAIALPLLAILAFFIFRGIAALLPLAVGGTAIPATLLVLRLVNTALPLSGFAVNVVIGLGLGLAIDYSLFLVWRFREELQRTGRHRTQRSGRRWPRPAGRFCSARPRSRQRWPA